MEGRAYPKSYHTYIHTYIHTTAAVPRVQVPTYTNNIGSPRCSAKTTRRRTQKVKHQRQSVEKCYQETTENSINRKHQSYENIHENVNEQ